jgi:iron complex transport system substrate-binding protein
MKRILSLLPSTTEILYMLGAEDHLVGITHECDYPDRARSKPRVTGARINPSMPSREIDALVREQLEDAGSLYTLDMDLVRELAPEIVLTQQLCTVCAVGYATVHAAMRALADPPVVMNVEPRTLDEVFASFVAIAAELGLQELGRKAVADLRARLAAIPSLDPKPRVLLLEWLIPPFAAGHWMPELVEAAGGTPVLHFKGEHSRGVSWEQIRAARFDVLVISCCGFPVRRAVDDVRACDELRDLLRERPDLRVIVCDGNHYFSRPGPRLVESAEILHAALAGIAAESVTATIPEPYVEMSAAEILQSAS